MTNQEHVLALFSDNEGQVSLHADDKGLEILITALQRLRQKISETTCEHDHLITEAWGGSGELTEAQGCETEGQLVHHLKLYGWTDEWAKKKKFIK